MFLVELGFSRDFELTSSYPGRQLRVKDDSHQNPPSLMENQARLRKR